MPQFYSLSAFFLLFINKCQSESHIQTIGFLHTNTECNYYKFSSAIEISRLPVISLKCVN